MSRRRAALFTQDLPPVIRDSIRDGAATVFAAAPSIFHDAHAEFTKRRRGDLVLAASVRRLWRLVDEQVRILDGTLAQLRMHDAFSIQAGASDPRPGAA